MMVSKFLDPKNDFAFRRIFGTERNKDILIHFLNDMLVFRDKQPIVDLTFLQTVQDPETRALKTSLVDVLCRDKDGHTYIVEMQVARERGFEKRAQYYASKAYIAQTKVGDEYHNLREIIFLAIANFVVFPNKKTYKSDHITLDKDSLEHDLKDFSFTFLELPKFNKGIDQLTNMIDKWAYFFKHAAETKESELKYWIGSDIIVERAYEELNRFEWNEEELRTYDQTTKYEWSRRATLESKYDEGIEKGLVLGREEGLEQGLEIGREEGLEKGREEGRLEALLTMARRLQAEHMSLESIAEYTGLSLEELKRL